MNFFKKLFSASGDKDPVCGMSVDLKTTKYKSLFQGKTYGFCSDSCKQTFDRNPANYT